SRQSLSMPTPRVRFDKDGRLGLSIKKECPKLRKLVAHPGRQSLSMPTPGVRFDKDGRPGPSTKKECPKLRKPRRSSWSTIFVEADAGGEIRQGWSTRTVDKEGMPQTQKT